MKLERSRAKVAEDRQNLSPLRTVLVALLSAGSSAAFTSAIALHGATGIFMLPLAVAAFVGMVVLRSVSMRNVAASLLFIEGVAAFFGAEMPVQLAFVSPPVVWLLLGVASIAVAGSAGVMRSFLRLARTSALAALLVVGLAVLLAPSMTSLGGDGTNKGRTFSSKLNPKSMLSPGFQQNMGVRPELTDELVMSVRADHAAMWRMRTYDVWDGQSWYVDYLDGGRHYIWNSFADDDEIDLAATKGEGFRQTYTLYGGRADILPAAASPVQARVSGGYEVGDGALIANEPQKQGATYTVESRQIPLSAEKLRSSPAPDVDSGVILRYAQEPVASERVARLASEITAGATTNYDKVLAIQKWMSENLTYSIDAPVDAFDTDLIDSFLFETKQGWCQQISTSLTVMLRLNGVPAREVVGYAPGIYNSITGRFDVKQRDAHAWTEVWFSDYGWVAFDPTVNVPLAPEPPPGRNPLGWLLDHALWIVLGLSLVIVGGPWLRRLVAAIRTKIAGRRTAAESTEATHPAAALERDIDLRLKAVGESLGHTWAENVTTSAYAATVAAHEGAHEVGAVGTLVDRSRYGSPPISDEEAHEALRALERAGNLANERGPGADPLQ